jgi:hypothetical protein
MTSIIVIAEGQSEEIFIKKSIAPVMREIGIFVKPLLLKTSRDASGGGITFDRFKFNARNTLLQSKDVFVTTFLDLYGLDSDFPGFQESKKINDLYQRVIYLENSLRDAIVDHVGIRPERFMPHIQPHEFEALLFSDIEKFISIEPGWAHAMNTLLKARSDVLNPEYINNSYETKPSKRLENCLQPTYRKTTHGPRGIERISLGVIEDACPHFKSWIDSLRVLSK